MHIRSQIKVICLSVKTGFSTNGAAAAAEEVDGLGRVDDDAPRGGGDDAPSIESIIASGEPGPDFGLPGGDAVWCE